MVVRGVDGESMGLLTKKSVVAVVVTYNRKEMLVECINALKAQTYPLSKIIIIDNFSTDGTFDYLVDSGVFTRGTNLGEDNFVEQENIKYYFQLENTGGAGGFRRGLEKAISENPSWVWVMDDDAEPDRNALEALMATELSERYSFLAPRVVHKLIPNHTEYYHHKTKIDLIKIKEENLRDVEIGEESYELEANGFVGPLLNTEAIRKVGLPDESFFIWWDDTDYTYALSRNYGKGLLVGRSVMYHKDKVVEVEEYSWKTYYGIRNRVRFFRKHVSLIGYLVLFLKTMLQYFKYYNQMDHEKLAEATIKELLN